MIGSAITIMHEGIELPYFILDSVILPTQVNVKGPQDIGQGSQVAILPVTNYMCAEIISGFKISDLMQLELGDQFQFDENKRAFIVPEKIHRILVK